MYTPFEDLSSVDCIEDTEQLEEMLSRPTHEVVETMRRLEGDLMILGVGGKTGPSLASMARKATDAAGVPRRIIGVSRFSNPPLRGQLEAAGIETIPCDLLDHRQLESLPEVPNIIFSAARKFGSTGNEAMTWAMNVYLPGMVAERYASSRLVVYSSGNIYPLVSVESNGSKETDDVGPVGEYAMSVLGRERLFTHFSQIHGTPVALVRLYYANEMRYGTLRDVGEKVLNAEPVDVTMGYFNAIWQGDSNAMTLRCFDRLSSPPFVVNVAGAEKISVRSAAERFGQLFSKPVRFVGKEAPDALFSDSRYGHEQLGRPRVSEDKIIQWAADWLQRNGESLSKPTHFQTRDGKF